MLQQVAPDLPPAVQQFLLAGTADSVLGLSKEDQDLLQRVVSTCVEVTLVTMLMPGLPNKDAWWFEPA